MSAFRPAAVCALASLAAACATSAPPPPAPLAVAPEIDAFVEEAMAEIGVVPGLAVAVYTPDGVYARGFGVTDVETGEPVTADTAFYIASSTKSYTALAMNLLDHRGALDLDASLEDVAPGAFPDSVTPGDVSLRSLLTHTSGVENNPVSWRAAYTGQHTPELNWELLAASEPNAESPLGSFEYTNTGYNVLTVITDRTLGVAWQDLLAREIFEPAGMTRTTAYMSKADAEDWSRARGHMGVASAEGATRVRLEKVDATMQSAGGLITSAHDEALWLELMAEDGVVRGERILPADVVAETRARLAAIDEDRDGDVFTRDAYGLGWFIGDFRGETVVYHFGGFAGARTHVSYLPDRRIGVAVLANEPGLGGRLADATAAFIYDRLAERPDARAVADAAVAEAVERRDGYVERFAQDRAHRAEREWTLSRPRGDYVGTYANPLYGEVAVSLDGEDLVVDFGQLHAVAEPYTAPESIRVELVPYSGEAIVFEMEEGAPAAALVLDGDRYARTSP